MLSELVNKIISLSRKPIEYIQDEPWLYSDAGKHYAPVVRPYDRRVSNIESLLDVVLEEMKRDNRPDGNYATVIFTDSGADFYPDDRKRKDKWEYKLQYSQQFLHFKSILGCDTPHRLLLSHMQALSHSFGPSFVEIYREFKRLTFDNSTKVVSQPMIIDGTTEKTLSFKLSATGTSGETLERLPAGFELTMPIIKGSKPYVFPVEMDAHVKDGAITFVMWCPRVEAIVEQRRLDEIESFKKELEACGMTEILVVMGG